MGFKTSIKGSIFYDNIGVPEEDHAAIAGGQQVSRYPVVRAYYDYVVQDR
jgi:hypothetical protein